MNVSIAGRLLAGLAAAALVWLSVSGSVEAQGRGGTMLKIQPLQDGAVVGQQMAVTAVLSDRTGAAVPGAEVTFNRDARFLNSTSELEIGRALTDGSGNATVQFLPRSEGEILILADFAGNAQYSASSDTLTVLVATGGPLYSQETGVKVPGINVSLLVAILAGVWATYFAVMAHVFLIARGDQQVRVEVSHE